MLAGAEVSLEGLGFVRLQGLFAGEGVSVPFMSAYPRQNLGELYKDC